MSPSERRSLVIQERDSRKSAKNSSYNLNASTLSDVSHQEVMQMRGKAMAEGELKAEADAIH